MRACIFIALLMFAWIPQASAQRGPEDDTRACPLITPELAKLAAANTKGRCVSGCRGCGCKGGPGYRGPDNGCVGYADIIRKCGPAPHKENGCKRECKSVATGCEGFGRVWLKELAKTANIVVEFVEADPEPVLASEPPILPSANIQPRPPATALTQSP